MSANSGAHNNVFSMTRPVAKKLSGTTAVSELLRTLRVRAGFESAAAAAIAYGWSGSTLAAHEGGRRRVSPLDAERYGEAFGYSPDVFQKPHQALNALRTISAERRDSTQSQLEPSARAMGGRLIVARRVRGFKRRSGACARLGFPRPTLTAHELGINSLVDTQGSDYATAYGIRLDWLLNGTFPSGLGSKVDEFLQNTSSPSDDDLDALAKIAGDYTPLHLADLRARVATEVQTGAIREAIPDYRSPKGFSELLPLRLWSMPHDYDRKYFGAPSDYIVALPDSRGGRFFVDVSDHDISKEGGFLLVDSASRVLVLEYPSRAGVVTAPTRLIGRVLAQMTVYARRTGFSS
ncbi:MAG: family transcriptional regulator, partial [Alphaproteobacteria bacterium]|nr:family transcriptional regulator [Alphaproteobacteria bacterium]